LEGSRVTWLPGHPLETRKQEEMISIQRNLAIFDKFKFERPPVGVKFLPNKPDGIKRLDKILDFCKMLKEAQEASPFYATKEDFTCIGPLLLGMVEHEPIFESGLVGPQKVKRIVDALKQEFLTE
jgi:uncharacterized protein (DUF169 family)